MHDRLQPRARWVDAGLIALAALLGSLFFLDSLKTAGERAAGFPTADLVVGALACLALHACRRWELIAGRAPAPGLSEACQHTVSGRSGSSPSGDHRH
jgi:hypothetical protein